MVVGWFGVKGVVAVVRVVGLVGVVGPRPEHRHRSFWLLCVYLRLTTLSPHHVHTANPCLLCIPSDKAIPVQGGCLTIRCTILDSSCL